MSDSSSTGKLTTKLSTSRSGLPNKQKGLSFLGVFALIAVVAFLALFAFKVVPPYIQFMTVSKIIDEAASNENLMNSPKSKVYAYIGQAYRTNNLWDLKAKETVELKKSGAGYDFKVNYEERSNLIHNIFVVTKFEKEVVQP